jgi:putative ABC transport system permease protein
MLWTRRLQLRLRSLFRKTRLDRELGLEIAHHLEQLKAEYMADGLDAAEAAIAARRSFGSATAISDECRDTRRTQWIEDFVQDTRFACRTFAKAPAFTLAAILTLGLGVGANTAFFSTAYAIVMRPLPYPESTRLVSVNDVVAVGPVTTLRSLSNTTEYAGYMPNNELDLQLGGDARKIMAAASTWNLLRVLRARPALGRWFEEAEERPGEHRKVVLSNASWRNWFGGDPGAVGRNVILNEVSFEVVGVMPAGFAFPTPETELWFPIRLDPRQLGYMWGGSNLIPVGRLRDGVTIAAANAELRPTVDRIRAAFPWRMPDEWAVDARVTRLDEAMAKNVRPKLFALAAAAFLLLLIACGNVANLLLGRTVLRQREIATREALGAGRTRLLRQILTENLALTVTGGLCGTLFAALILNMLPLLLPKDTPRLHEVGTTHATLLSTAGGAMALIILLFSAVPLLRSWKPAHDPLVARVSTATRRASRMTSVLIGAELALAATLLIGAGLMVRTLLQLHRVDAGVDSTSVVSARLSAGPSRCANPQACLSFLEEVGRTLNRTGGVRSVSWANHAPLEKQISAISVEIQDHPRPPGAPAYVLWQTAVTAGYFPALGISLREGRLFTDTDAAGGMPVAIISEATARRFWPKESAIGKHIAPVANKSAPRLVIGVVSDVAHYALTGFPSWIDGVQYVPLAQVLPAVSSSLQVSMIVESANPRQASAVLASAVQKRFSGVVVSRARTFDSLRSESINDQRSTAGLLALFSGLGLLLGVIGVHGVVSHRVAQRTREIGIRIALGSTAARVVRAVLRETAVVALFGVALGVAGAFMLSRYLRTLLFGMGDHDVVVFVVCPSILIAAALLSALIPALRASRIDPAVTLRQD